MTQPRRRITHSEDDKPPSEGLENRTLEDVAATIRLIRRWGGPTLVAAVAAALYTAWQLPRRMERVEEDHRQMRSMQAYVVCIAHARRFSLNMARCDRLDPSPTLDWSGREDSTRTRPQDSDN